MGSVYGAIEGLAKWLLVAALGALYLIIRDPWAVDAGLGYDEIFATAYLNGSLLELVIAVIRFDIHPPLYYMQLWGWAVFFGSTDAALVANSSLWALLTVLAVFRMIADVTKSLLLGFVVGTAVFFSSSELLYSTEIRMYSMLSCMATLAAHQSILAAQNPSSFNKNSLLIILLLCAYTHGTGALVAICSLVYLVTSATDPASRWKCLQRFLVLFLLVTPVLLNGIVKSTGHAIVPSYKTIATVTCNLYIECNSTFAAIAFGVIFIAGTIAMLLNRGTSLRLIVSFLVAPVLLVASFSLAIRPIWVDRMFSFAAPTAIAAFGILFFEYRHRFWPGEGSRSALFSSLSVALVFVGVLLFAPRHPIEAGPYRDSAREIMANPPQGNVWIPSNVALWGIARYAIGPQWGNLLLQQDLHAPDRSAIWGKVVSTLGVPRARQLGLLGESREVRSGERYFYIGPSELSPDQAKTVSTIILTRKELLLTKLPCEVVEVATYADTSGPLVRFDCAAPR
jgi:hypothetical protein